MDNYYYHQPGMFNNYNIPVGAIHNDNGKTNIGQYFDSFPSGYRFRPTDEELIVDYLQKKVMNQPLPINRIHEVNLYNYNPQDLTGMYKLHRESEWYFFTSREKKYPNGSRPKRAAGNGYWKPTGTDKTIRNEDQVIGYKKSLDFYIGKHPSGTKTAWKMHEYRVDEKCNPSNKRCKDGMKLDDWVLCKVYKKSDKKKDKNNEDVQIPNNQEELVIDSSPTREQDLNDTGDGKSHGFTSTTLINNTLANGIFSYSMGSIPEFNNDMTLNKSLKLAIPNHVTSVESLTKLSLHVSEGKARSELAPPNNVASVEQTSYIQPMPAAKDECLIEVPKDEDDDLFEFLQYFSVDDAEVSTDH